MEKKVLKIEGMSCEHCVRAVTNALGALPGITDIKVDLKHKTAAFNFDPAETPLEKISAAITEEGYEVLA
jgi:copper chaperone